MLAICGGVPAGRALGSLAALVGFLCKARCVADSPLKAVRRVPSYSTFSPLARLSSTVFAVAACGPKPPGDGFAGGLTVKTNHFESCEKPNDPPPPRNPANAAGTPAGPPGPPPGNLYSFVPFTWRMM